MRTFWLAEHPTLPVWRIKQPYRQGKLGELTCLITASVDDALQFETKEECERWIAANPSPPFKATEHSMMR